jgi:aminopeptidase
MEKGDKMPDPRITKLADVLVHYSLDLKPGDHLALGANTAAEELALEVYKIAVQTGAHVHWNITFPGAREILFKYASDDQLDYVSPVDRFVDQACNAHLFLEAPQNTRQLSGTDPTRMARRAKAYQPLNQEFMERSSRGEVRWCYTVFPTNAAAQEADMSLSDYAEFVYAADMLDEANPVAAWQAVGQQERTLVDWLAGKDRVVLKGKDIDLAFSIKGRTFVAADGKVNMPDGEIFTGPVENSAQGWVRFHYPAIEGGREVEDVELWFEDGKVVKESAKKNEEFLTAQLNTDPGARYLGEWGIGTNYSIPRFSKHMLFDEKLGGTIHLALGMSYPEMGGKNESGLHWDMLCDMSEAEITVDGEVFYRDGKPVLWK